MTCRWFFCALIAGVCCGFYGLAPWLDRFGTGEFKWEPMEPYFVGIAGLFVVIGLLIKD